MNFMDLINLVSKGGVPYHAIADFYDYFKSRKPLLTKTTATRYYTTYNP